MEWIATPPGGTRPRRQAHTAARRRYTGPPSYPAMPRWGFPPLAWRWPLALDPRTRADPTERTSALAATATSTLWVTVLVAGIAAAAEAWRYSLLLASLRTALSKTTLAFSDSLVATAGVLTWVMGMLSGVVVVFWALRARTAACERVNVLPSRSDAQFVVGVVVPGWNLFVPGSVLAELEHTVLAGENARELHARPKPSRLVKLWWAAWVVSLLLGWAAFLWSFRTDAQSLADGVVLHIWMNLGVVVLAVLTLRVIQYLTRLVTPVDPLEARRQQVLRVRDAPSPGRAVRSADAPR